MRRPAIRLLTLWAIAVAASFATSDRVTARPPAAVDRSAIQGFWEHETCQVVEGEGGRTSSRSIFSFFQREWGIAFTQYADADCRTKVLTAVLSGQYEATSSSARVPGAAEVTFRFSRKVLTVYDQGLIDRLNGGACGDRRWQRGVEEDVTSSGCMWIESVSACRQEYDLVKIDNGGLYLGERPPPGTNLCAASRRPQRLRAVPLVRR